MTTLVRARRSLTLYPVTVLYVTGSVIAWLVAGQNITLLLGFALLTLVAALMLVVGVWREVRLGLLLARLDDAPADRPHEYEDVR